MNYPAASSGVSIGIFIIAPRGGESYPCPPRRIETGIEWSVSLSRYRALLVGKSLSRSRDISRSSATGRAGKHQRGIGKSAGLMSMWNDGSDE